MAAIISSNRVEKESITAKMSDWQTVSNGKRSATSGAFGNGAFGSRRPTVSTSFTGPSGGSGASGYVPPSLRKKEQTYDEMYPQVIGSGPEKVVGATSTAKQLSLMVSRLAEQDAMERMRLQVRAEKAEKERLEYGSVPSFVNYHRKVAARAKAAEMRASAKDMAMLSHSEFTLFRTVAQLAWQRPVAEPQWEEADDDFGSDDGSECSTVEPVEEDF